MLLGGGSSCQQCGCGGGTTPCPECTHFSALDFFDGATFAASVNGSSVPSNTGASTLDITPSGVVQSACWGTLSSSLKVRFTYSFNPADNYEYVVDENGCDQVKLTATINAQITIGECTFTWRCGAARVTGACSDTGGSATLSAWSYYGSDCAGSPSEDCAIEMLDWIASQTVSASFSYPACECPP